MKLQSVGRKKCEYLKIIIDTKYSNFDDPVFQNMKWLDPNLGPKATRSRLNNTFLWAF